nr:hypothetical protein [Tanacetum cinerariifolium]
MTWVRWNKCLASKDLGGLGIGSIFGLNIGLLFKWIWRFLRCPSDLWVTIIKNIYGSHGGINDTSTLRFSHSTWGGILSFIKRIKQKGNDLFSYCARKIDDGASTRLWEDTLCGDQPLKTLFPRIYLLESDKHCFVKNRFPFQDLSSALRRHPRSGAEMAQFSDLQAKIAIVVLSDQDTDLIATCWNRHIPIKVNIFIWSLMLNKLSFTVNLDRRGIDVGWILCPICQADVETINHIFFSFDMALELWVKLARWWGLDIPVCANILEWFEWIDSLHSSNIVKTTFEGVGGSLMWSIWSYINRLIFSNPPSKKAVLWDAIVSQLYL